MEPMDTMFEEFSTNRCCVLVVHIVDNLHHSKGRYDVII